MLENKSAESAKESKAEQQSNMFAFAPPNVWKDLIEENGGIENVYADKLKPVLKASKMAAPLRMWENFRHRKKVENTKIHPSPIFVLGHHRSGTTHLHNILSKDPQFGYLTTFQAVAPSFAVTGNGKIKAKLEEGLPKKRSMDEMDASLDAPQEEEIAVSNLSRHSFNHHMSFPQKTLYYLDKYLTLETINYKEKEERKKAYKYALKLATYLSGGKRLVLKSPVNTAQVTFLLEMFPEAKFIYIYRNPYHVFPSVVNLALSLGPAHRMHDFSIDQVETNILLIYEKMMKKYLADRNKIPKNQLIEIKFEDLEKNSINNIATIYSKLDIPNFEGVKDLFTNYLKGLKNYKKNKFQLDQEKIDQISTEWGFSIDAFGYDRM